MHNKHLNIHLNLIKLDMKTTTYISIAPWTLVITFDIYYKKVISETYK